MGSMVGRYGGREAQLAQLGGGRTLQENKLAAAHSMASHEGMSWSGRQQHSKPLPQPSADQSTSPAERV